MCSAQTRGNCCVKINYNSTCLYKWGAASTGVRHPADGWGGGGCTVKSKLHTINQLCFPLVLSSLWENEENVHIPACRLNPPFLMWCWWTPLSEKWCNAKTAVGKLLTADTNYNKLWAVVQPAAGTSWKTLVFSLHFPFLKFWTWQGLSNTTV